MQPEILSSSGKRTLLKAIGAAAVIAAGAFAYSSLSGSQPAPEVSFTSLSGETVSMQSLRGRVVMVNFWATSCTTCIKEMPQMVQTYNKYKDKGLDFVAVAMSYDPPNYVLNYAQTRQLPFRVALDTRGDIAKSFDDVKLTPTTYVIDKQGRIIKRYVGEPDFAALHQLIEKALAA
ncbi:MAG TPA: TlpA disulfide reductase family protein [Noviherbaspirillum sp.]|uniref:TlpA disulfide reductase family protein n=1 Tax=Noviherbaspirillum sp. TaxID=1926288 RepID=UPI002D4B5E39|nr:TlpA disulfide reductase family protein [Noviherbaspirillum sp.]HYD97486.1 TlpA disulfide reductase family protein [Noviherbaspirillum sp.]